MNWLTKSLTLDLIAITIDSLNRISERISTESNDGAGNWPPAEQNPAPAPAPEPAPAAQSTNLDPAAQAEQQAALHTKAQETLRNIALKEGTDWITGTLFPSFNVGSLNDIPADKLNELITQAENHTKA